MRRDVAERFGCGPDEVTLIGCHYCGDAIFIDRTGRRTRFRDSLGRSFPELDHVEPLFHNGPHVSENLVPACLRCNRSKGSRRLVGAQ
jgi:5-methylcytosine-specific restriction endonuclease McrA